MVKPIDRKNYGGLEVPVTDFALAHLISRMKMLHFQVQKANDPQAHASLKLVYVSTAILWTIVTPPEKYRNEITDIMKRLGAIAQESVEGFPSGG